MPDRTFRVLVIDDEPALLEVLVMRLEHWGYEPRGAGTAEEAQKILADEDPDIVLSDVVLPELSGLDLLKKLKASDQRRPVILMTAHGSIDVAVEAMKAGAEDFLTKPLDSENLHSLLDDVAERLETRGRIRELETRLDRNGGLGPLIGESKSMRELFEVVELLAGSDASALIAGESGSGKEMVARAVHQLSKRKSGPFLAMNSAAIPDGLVESELFGHEKGAFTGATYARPGCFEQADGGTLLLDEISEMPMSLQPKLLRILEDGGTRRVGGTRSVDFDVRVLAATNRPPEEAVEKGRLREDLLFRLNVFSITVPPLRERRSDIPLLTQHFVREFNRKHGTEVEGLRDETRELLEGYPWPGNVRELRNVTERAVIIAKSGLLEPSHLPPYVHDRGNEPPTVTIPVGVTAHEAEKQLILKTLEHVGNNKTEAARQLGLDPKTIRNKLNAYEAE